MSLTTMNPAATWITSSREAAAQTRTLLGETHSLIALNRRRLNPWWGVSGSSGDGEDALFQSVLDRLQQGGLVPAPAKVWAGEGTGQICVICRETIHSDDVENEVAINGGSVTVKLWAHAQCLTIWRWATITYVEQNPSAAHGQAD